MARLMISVRSVDEATVAIRHGADLVDVKEPANGSLGMAAPEVIEGVVAALPRRVPLGVSLGEWREWCSRERPATCPRLPRGIGYLKVGLSGARDEVTCGAGRRRLLRWREETLRQNRLGADAHWVAVLYADWERAGAPAPAEVLDLARDGFGAILVDTHVKDGIPDGLFRFLDSAALGDIVAFGRDHGMPVVLSGALSADGVERAAALGADVVGVRTAACRGSSRDGKLDPGAVRHLAESLRADSPSRTPPAADDPGGCIDTCSIP